jgi:hypothetical protein
MAERPCRPTTVAEALESCPIIRTGDRFDAAESARHRRAARQGALVRLLPGILFDAAAWKNLWPEHRFAVRSLAATNRLPQGAVFSHLSAAVIGGWSIDGAYPPLVECSRPGAPRRRSNATFTIHAAPDELDIDQHCESLYAAPVTTKPRTAVDLARALPFRHGVTILDQALHAGVPEAELLDLIDSAPRRPGSARARTALDFADAGADNVGESALRVTVHEAGLPRCVTQRRFHDGGRTAYADLWFEEAGVVVEFDGHGKYQRIDQLNGRSTAEVLIAEKDREDWMRSFPEVRGFVRFGWSQRRDVVFVRQRLLKAGVRPGR